MSTPKIDQFVILSFGALRSSSLLRVPEKRHKYTPWGPSGASEDALQRPCRPTPPSRTQMKPARPAWGRPGRPAWPPWGLGPAGLGPGAEHR